MKNKTMKCAGILVIMLAGCSTSNPSMESASESSTFAHDLTTPEGAILCLEDAYRSENLEAAINCKDFNTEARLMLESLGTDFSDDQEILSTTAEVLELGFRSEMEKGFPTFHGITSTFANKKPFQGRDDIVEITETCRHKNGTTTTNKLLVAKTAEGWKVVMLPELNKN